MIPLSSIPLKSRNTPNIRYTAHRVCDLSSKTYLYLSTLNFRDVGMMVDIRSLRKWSKKSLELENAGYVIIATHCNGMIIGWSLLFNEAKLRRIRTRGRDIIIDMMKSYPRWTGEFYVKKSWRGYGIGSELFDRVRLIRKTFYKYRHDPVSTSFFRKNSRSQWT